MSDARFEKGQQVHGHVPSDIHVVLLQVAIDCDAPVGDNFRVTGTATAEFYATAQ